MSTTVEAKSTKLQEAIDKGVAGEIVMSNASGGVSFRSMLEVMEFAKLMAIGKESVPPHCRNAVGVCLGVIIHAIEWRMSPYAVANKSYVVNDRLSFESQLIHAVIEQRAPIVHRLKHSFSGSGPSRKCKVWSTAKGESEPLVYESPEIKDIKPKNSPLWTTKPDLQLFYNASRDWARMYFPDVLMGVYAEDELEREPVVLVDATSVKSAVSRTASLRSRVVSEPVAVVDVEGEVILEHCESPPEVESDSEPENEISSVLRPLLGDEAAWDRAIKQLTAGKSESDRDEVYFIADQLRNGNL